MLTAKSTAANMPMAPKTDQAPGGKVEDEISWPSSHHPVPVSLALAFSV